MTYHNLFHKRSVVYTRTLHAVRLVGIIEE